jgi:hypothetical protein
MSDKTIPLEKGDSFAVGLGAHGTDKTVHATVLVRNQPPATAHMTAEEARTAGDALHEFADELDRASKAPAS